MNTAILRSRILDMAIRGQLVPQDPSDGTADDLLKTIAVQRGKPIIPITDNVPFSIPENWRWVKLGDISIKIVDGDHNPPKGVGYKTEYRMFSSQNINFDKLVDIDSCRYLSKETFDIVFSRTNVERGDILLTCVGTLGRSCVYSSDEKIAFQRSVSVIKTLCLQEYVKRVFDCPYAQHIFIKESTGTAQKGFYLNKLQNTLIPLPPLSEQHRIVAKVEELLSEVDKIEHAQTDITHAATILRSRVLDSALRGELTHSNTKEWESVKLGDVAQYVNGRAFKPIEWESNGIPIIRIQNLNDKDAAYNYSTATYEDKYLIHNGDLLFAWAASLGVFIWDRGEAWLNQHIFRVLPYDFMDKQYFYYVLQNLIREFYTQAHGSGMVHITKDKFENCQIPLPPLSEQHRIVAKIEQLFTEIDKLVK